MGLMSTKEAGKNAEAKHIGTDAAYLVSFINKLFQSSKNTSKPDSEAEKKAKEEFEKQIREKVTAELMEKFKTGGARSIDDLPGGRPSKEDEAGIFTGRRLSEAEVAKLSPSDRQKYLMGA